MSTRCPQWFHRVSIGFMFYAELVAPFFMFGTRWMRRTAFASMVLLQLLIAATGNYGFFNLLSIVLCLTMLDDRDWEWLIGACASPSRTPLVNPRSETESSRALRSNGRSPGEWPWASAGVVMLGADDCNA